MEGPLVGPPSKKRPRRAPPFAGVDAATGRAVPAPFAWRLAVVTVVGERAVRIAAEKLVKWPHLARGLAWPDRTALYAQPVGPAVKVVPV